MRAGRSWRHRHRDPAPGDDLAAHAGMARRALFSGCGRLSRGMRYLQGCACGRRAMPGPGCSRRCIPRMHATTSMRDVVARCPGRSLVDAGRSTPGCNVRGSTCVRAHVRADRRARALEPLRRGTSSKIFQVEVWTGNRSNTQRAWWLEQARRPLVEGRLPVTEVSLASGSRESPAASRGRSSARFGVSAERSTVQIRTRVQPTLGPVVSQLPLLARAAAGGGTARGP